MTIHFPDVSHHNAPLSLVGAPVVFAKATQGVSYTDPAYAGFRTKAAIWGALFVAYHWLDSTNAAAQARHCFSVVGPNVPLMVDDEQQRIVVAHTLEFVAAYRALGGQVWLEYAPRWVWADSGQPDLRPLAAAGLHIISSHYVTAYSDTGPGWASYGGVTPTIWQWTDHHLFNGRYVDFNAYRGSRDQLAVLLRHPMTGGEDTMTPAEFVALLKNPTVAAMLRAMPWQYQDANDTSAHNQLLGNTLGGLRDRLHTVDTKLDGLLTAVGAIGTGNPDVVAILAGVDARLAAARAGIEADARDVVADGLEGGAAKVRADTDPTG